MADYFFTLSEDDQREVIQVVSARIGRPAYLLEKDLWVVWTLRALFESPLAGVLTFKGGTSLSKAYGVINRFSEDIDLTYNIRHLLHDLVGDDELPTSRSQKDKWTKAARERLPTWIANKATPLIQERINQDNLTVTLAPGGNENDCLLLTYPALTEGPGYVKPVVTLEFGARATGEPHAAIHIQCDLDGHVPEIVFPTASPVVMSIARTFWEKATAAHVYCAQHRIRGERYARHWHDLAAMATSSHFQTILADRAVAKAVAEHKAWFFKENDAGGTVIDYHAAIKGGLRLVPDGEALAALAKDYEAMSDAGVLLGDVASFEQLMQRCAEIEAQLNSATA